MKQFNYQFSDFGSPSGGLGWDILYTMNNSEFETQAIRNQLERTQYLEHSVPLYLTSSFVFEDAEDMRLICRGKRQGQPIQQPK
jgi:hypothetical protein